jgi:outer membrane protein TolC
MRHIFRGSLLVLLATLLPGGAEAAVETLRVVTLDEAVRLGLARNPRLAATRSEAGASEADFKAARASRWPGLFTEFGWHRTDNPVNVFGDKLTAGEFAPGDFAIQSLNHPGPIDHARAAVGIEAPLFTSGRVTASIDVARERSAADSAGLRETEADLVQEVTEAYHGLSLAQAQAGVAEAALENAAAHERLAETRFQNGAALKSDFLRARVYRLGRDRDLERRLADLEQARSRLRVLIGLDENEAIDFTANPLETPAQAVGSLEDWSRGAASDRPGLEAARRAAAAARAAARAESATRGPDFSGLARYERNASGLDGGEGSFFLGLNVRWLAIDPGRGPRIDAAQARAAEAEASSRAAADAVRLEVERAGRDVVVADHNLVTAREAVSAAEEVRRIDDERYASGLLPLSDLLDSERALLEARLAEVSSLHDAVVGRVRLARAAGRLEVPR